MQGLAREASSWGRAWRFMNDHGLAEIGTQQCPGGMPPLTLDQTTQSQDRLTTWRGPRHPRSFHALRDQCLTTGFDHAAGNRQLMAHIFGIVHAPTLIAEVGEFSLQAFPFVTARATALVLQDPNDLFSTLVGFFEQDSSRSNSALPRGVLSPQAASQAFLRWSQA